MSHCQLRYKKTPRTELILVLERFQRLPPNLHLGVLVPGCIYKFWLPGKNSFIPFFFLEFGLSSSGLSPRLLYRSVVVFRLDIPTPKYLVSPPWTCMAFNKWSFKTTRWWQPSIHRCFLSKEQHQWASNYRDILLQWGTINISSNPKSTPRKTLWELQNTCGPHRKVKHKEMDHFLEAKKSRKRTLLYMYPLCAGHHHGYFTHVTECFSSLLCSFHSVLFFQVSLSSLYTLCHFY